MKLKLNFKFYKSLVIVVLTKSIEYAQLSFILPITTTFNFNHVNNEFDDFVHLGAQQIQFLIYNIKCIPYWKYYENKN